MCGIAGQFGFQGRIPDLITLEKMSQHLIHRGPDGEGQFSEGSYNVAHRRLAIIDLSKDGHQPMISSSGRFVMSWNGECYNYLELKNCLELNGIMFKSKSDTEVVLEGIEREGLAFIHKVNGMFAFSLYDRSERVLYLFRDRMGIKPLYWSLHNGVFLYASEIKPILGAIGQVPQIQETSLKSYLKLRYVVGENTLFKGIYRVAPGSSLRVTLDGKIEKSQYWNILSRSLPRNNISLAQASHEFMNLLEDSVKLRMRSDVSVGSFLSAGIDSATLSVLAKRHNEKLNTFTINMETNSKEVQEAAQFAQQQGFNHNEISFSAGSVELLQKSIFHLEEPIGDSIISPTFELNRSASLKNKVVLSGEGADETLMGYAHHKVLPRLFRALGQIPSEFHEHVGEFIKNVPLGVIEKLNPYPIKFGRELVERLSGLFTKTNNWEQFLALVELFPDSLLKELGMVRNDLENKMGFEFSQFWKATAGPKVSPSYQLQQQDLNFWCPDYTLLRVDKLSMASGLEVRVPYLDHRLVEFCISLPEDILLKGRRQKYILRRGVENRKILGPAMAQKRKYPFYLPVEKSVNSKFVSYSRQVLLETPHLQNFGFSRKKMEMFVSDTNWSGLKAKQVVNLLNLCIWGETFLNDSWRK